MPPSQLRRSGRNWPTVPRGGMGSHGPPSPPSPLPPARERGDREAAGEGHLTQGSRPRTAEGPPILMADGSKETLGHTAHFSAYR
jgi:hypothetical protein